MCYLEVKCKSNPKGLSVDTKHKDWFEILKHNWGAYASVDPQTAVAEGNIVMSRPLVVSCRASEGTALMYAAHYNKEVCEVTFDIMDNGFPEAGTSGGYRKDASEKLTWQLKLKSAHITSISTRSSGEVLMDNIEFFGRYVTFEYKGDVKTDATVEYDWTKKSGG
jgi:hypothetical protein